MPSNPLLMCLASQSRGRKSLLEKASVNFMSIPADIDESLLPDESPANYVQRLAVEKAQAVLTDAQVTVAADSVAVLDGEILGKPQDKAAAVEMLKQMQGRTHVFLTGYCVKSTSGVISGVCTTQVEFHPLTEESIILYVDAFLNKILTFAGAYEHSGISSFFVKAFEGSVSNVQGLPMDLVAQAVEQLGFSWFDFLQV